MDTYRYEFEECISCLLGDGLPGKSITNKLLYERVLLIDGNVYDNLGVLNLKLDQLRTACESKSGSLKDGSGRRLVTDNRLPQGDGAEKVKV